MKGRAASLKAGWFKTRKTRSARGAEAGFTLIELLVVLVIVGLLAGLVAPEVLGRLGSAKHKVAETEISRLAAVLDLYRLDMGRYPSTEEGLRSLLIQPVSAGSWNGPYLKSAQMPADPWGSPYRYRRPSQRRGFDYDLYTLGADGALGGDGENADVFNK